MGGSSMVPLNRTSSIENEPRTLKLNQIQFARDAALYVINTRGLEEAMRIFTEGLEPVSHCVHDKEEDGVIMELESLSSPLRVNPGIRDIATAPFLSHVFKQNAGRRVYVDASISDLSPF